MVFKKKSIEDLQEQAKGFLDFAERNGRIYERTKDDILIALGLKESEKKGLIERFSKKLGKELDISDVKKLKRIFSEKEFNFKLFCHWIMGYWETPMRKKYGFDFNTLYGEYSNYLKAVHFIDKYTTQNNELYNFVLNYVFESFYTKKNIEKLDNLRIFLDSNAYKKSTLRFEYSHEKKALHDFFNKICEYRGHKFAGKDEFIKILNLLSNEDFEKIIKYSKHDEMNDRYDSIFSEEDYMNEFLRFIDNRDFFEKYGIGIDRFLDNLVVAYDRSCMSGGKSYNYKCEVRRKFLNKLHSSSLLHNRYENITPENLKSLDEIAQNSIPKILEIIFEKYPEIKIEGLVALENKDIHILSSARLENLKIIFEKYPEIDIEGLVALENKDIHILSSARLENLKIIFEKYPKITVKELVLLDDILKWNKVLLLEFLNWGTLTPSSKSLKILDLFNDDTKTHDEIFENIENKEVINDKNRIDIVGLYSAIEYFEDDETISDEIKSSIRGLINNEDKKDSIKDFIYKKLFELLKKSLSDKSNLNNEEIALLAVLNKKGLWNMGQSESLAKFIYQINKLDKNYKFEGALNEIKGGIKKFLNSHKKDSQESMNSFFQISTSLLEKSPAIYRNLIKLLNKLNGHGQEIFLEELFQLYNVELFLGEKSGKNQSDNTQNYKLLGIDVKNDVEGQLIPMNDIIKKLLSEIELGNASGSTDLLKDEKTRLVNNIKKLFKEKFGIKKVPSEFTNESIESIKWHSIYLSNMHECDQEKSAVLGYFLALKLDGKRTEFRTGKDFDPNEYMDDSVAGIIADYLSARKSRSSVNKLNGITDEDKKILQENEHNSILGNTKGIIPRLLTILDNVTSLIDDDIYSDKQKILKKYIYENNNLNEIISNQVRKLLGSKINITRDDENLLRKIIKEIYPSDDVDGMLSNVEIIKEIQTECTKISRILEFVNYITNSFDVMKEVEDFNKLCNPSDECLNILKKLNIKMAEDNKIISTDAFLAYVEYSISKGKNKLDDTEYKVINEYIKNIHKELDDLYGIKNSFAEKYDKISEFISKEWEDDSEFKKRFKDMSPNFFTKAEQEEKTINSLMTNDLDIVIKNIRQCLGCKTGGCNNDTDLSFGCDDRFFITTSHREGDGSFADELVTLLPRKPKEDGFTFVMDKIYADKGSTDILLNNIYVILKKIDKLSPNLKKQLSIFVPDGINLRFDKECAEKIMKQYNGVSIEKKDITVKVEEQPITDSYHEFGGLSECRGTGIVKISGYLIKFQ